MRMGRVSTKQWLWAVMGGVAGLDGEEQGLKEWKGQWVGVGVWWDGEWDRADRWVKYS